MPRQKSQTQVAMAAKLESLDPASPRYHILSAAREFKASWVDLGERLTIARDNQVYTAWGFASFELYCRRELQIKSDTANKLTRSFSYLRDNEPTILEGRQGQALPSLDVVDLLSQAAERTQITPDALDTIREQVMAPEAQVTRADVLKKFREADPEAFKPVSKPKDPVHTGPNDLRKALLLAERLEGLLSAQVSEGFAVAAQKAQDLATELRVRFEETQKTAGTKPGAGARTPGVHHADGNAAVAH